MKSLFAVFSFASLSAFAVPSFQFEQKGGVRSATYFASCSEAKDLVAQRISQAEIVDKTKLRFLPPILSESAEKRCVISCPAGAKLLALEMETAGSSPAPVRSLVCTEIL
jgi:hypothetical protein